MSERVTENEERARESKRERGGREVGGSSSEVILQLDPQCIGSGLTFVGVAGLDGGGGGVQDSRLVEELDHDVRLVVAVGSSAQQVVVTIRAQFPRREGGAFHHGNESGYACKDRERGGKGGWETGNHGETFVSAQTARRWRGGERRRAKIRAA